MCHQLSNVQERAMETMHRLSMEYALLKDRQKRKKVVEEMDKLELEFLEVNEKAQEYLDGHKDELSSLETEASENTELQKAWQRKAQNKFEGTKLGIKRSLMITKSHQGIKSSLQRDIRLWRSKIYERTVRRANARLEYVESTKENFHSRI